VTLKGIGVSLLLLFVTALLVFTAHRGVATLRLYGRFPWKALIRTYRTVLQGGNRWMIIVLSAYAPLFFLLILLERLPAPPVVTVPLALATLLGVLHYAMPPSILLLTSSR
jgi:hypothetical protein